MNHANPGARYIQVGNAAGAASTIAGLVLRNKLLTLVGHSLFATPAELRRSAYAQLAVIRVDGNLGAMTLSAFPGMTPQHRGTHTVLTGWLDQSALYGVLAQMEALGLVLVEVRRGLSGPVHP